MKRPAFKAGLFDWQNKLKAETFAKFLSPPTAEIQTQVFGCFCFKYPLTLLKYPLNPLGYLIIRHPAAF